MRMKIAVIAFLSTITLCALADFNLTIVHISDFHSQWYEFDENKHDCSKEESKAGKCYGGFARLLTFVRNIRKKEKNVLVLSSGEFFLGNSLNALHGWKMAHALLPKLELDAMSLSNHDFDSGIFQLSIFLYAMKFPILCANLVARDASFLYSRVNKSVVLDVNGTKVGIVGYIHRHALEKTRRAVSVTFVPEIPVLQEEVSRLESEGVDKIIALGHAGYHTDLELAKNVKGVDIVIGGDSDIVLFDTGHDADELLKVGNIHGHYPRVHHQEPETADDPSLVNKTLVLHIPQHGMYVGVLRVTFDDTGKIIHESGEPVMLDSSIPQDVATLEFLEYAKGALEEINQHMRLPDDAEILGVTKKHLDGYPRHCRMFECSLGNFIADAMLHEFTFHYRNKSENRGDAERWGPIDALVINSGCILRSIEPGFITIKDITKSLYVGGFIQRTYMSGQQLLDMMEHNVKHYDVSGVTAPGSFLQISGLKVVYDLSQLPGKRVRSLMIRCRDCGDDNIYHPIVSYKTYVIGMPNFMHEGRDGFYDFEDLEAKDFGQFDALLIVEHLRRIYEVVPKLDGRIQFYRSNVQSNSSLVPPLLFGEPASEYNKLNGVLSVKVNERDSESDTNRKEKKLDTKNEKTVMKHYKEHENKSVSFVSEASSELTNLSNLTLVTETSAKILNKSVEKIHNDNLKQELSSFKIAYLKDKDDTSKMEENRMNRLNHHDSDANSLVIEMKKNEPDQKNWLNQEYLHEISSNLLDESKKATERYLNPLVPKVKNLKSNDEGIDKISKGNENDAIHLSKENIQLPESGEKILDVPTTREAERILNISKISDALKILSNSSFGSSLEKNSSKFADFPESSDLLEKLSQIKNFKKRSVEHWMDDSGNVREYFEFKNNISNFVESLEKLIRSNQSVNNNSSLSEDEEGVFAEDFKNAFEAIVKHILTGKILNNLIKHHSVMLDALNTTATNRTDLDKSTSL